MGKGGLTVRIPITEADGNVHLLVPLSDGERREFISGGPLQSQP